MKALKNRFRVTHLRFRKNKKREFEFAFDFGPSKVNNNRRNKSTLRRRQIDKSPNNTKNKGKNPTDDN